MSHSFHLNWKRTVWLALVIGLALIGSAAAAQAKPAAPAVTYLVTNNADPAVALPSILR